MPRRHGLICVWENVCVCVFDVYLHDERMRDTHVLLHRQVLSHIILNVSTRKCQKAHHDHCSRKEQNIDPFEDIIGVQAHSISTYAFHIRCPKRYQKKSVEYYERGIQKHQYLILVVSFKTQRGKGTELDLVFLQHEKPIHSYQSQIDRCSPNSVP